MQSDIQEKLKLVLSKENGEGLFVADLVDRVMTEMPAPRADLELREVDVRAALLPMIRGAIIEYRPDRRLALKQNGNGH